MHRSKAIAVDEYKTGKKLLDSLGWSFEMKNSDRDKLGSNLPAKVWEKLDVAIDGMSRVERDAKKLIASGSSATSSIRFPNPH